MRRAHHNSALHAVLVALAVAGLGGPRAARAAPPLPQVDVTGPRPAADGDRFLSVDDPTVRPGAEARAWARLTRDPLRWQSPQGEELALLSTVAGGHFSLGLARGPARVALSLPVHAALAGDRRATGGAIGDPGLDLKLRALDGARGGLAAVGRLTAPLGAAAQAAGSPGWTAEAGLCGRAQAGPAALGAQLGWRGLPAATPAGDDVLQTTYGDRLRLGLAAGLGRGGPDDPAVAVELIGERELAELGEDWRSSPAELGLSGQWSPRPGGPRLLAAGAVGISAGVGAPLFRVQVGVGARQPPGG
jgi:hypothetical protein